MIPVLACPILNHPDLLEQMLGSVDETVARVYIIDNGGVVPDDIACAWAKRIHVADTGCNLGVARSWNLAIEANLDAPWWLIVNNDIVFAPGALARLGEAMDAATGPLVGSLWGFGAFALNAAAVETAGWFDPCFTPIYFEDSDWQRRAVLKGIPQVNIHSDTVHLAERSHAADPALTEANTRTKYVNRERYERKWGRGQAGLETFDTPFDAGGDPAIVTLPPLSLLRAQRWPL